jgi:hypothetical protein
MTQNTSRPSRARQMPQHLRTIRTYCGWLDYEADDLATALGYRVGYLGQTTKKRNPPANPESARQSIQYMKRLMLECWALLDELDPQAEEVVK